jgi:hypothetical protein
MAEYRRQHDSEVWHWRRDCRDDPKFDYVTREEAPGPSHTLCEICRKKEEQASAK